MKRDVDINNESGQGTMQHQKTCWMATHHPHKARHPKSAPISSGVLWLNAFLPSSQPQRANPEFLHQICFACHIGGSKLRHKNSGVGSTNNNPCESCKLCICATITGSAKAISMDNTYKVRLAHNSATLCL